VGKTTVGAQRSLFRNRRREKKRESIRMLFLTAEVLGRPLQEIVASLTLVAKTG